MFIRHLARFLPAFVLAGAFAASTAWAHHAGDDSQATASAVAARTEVLAGTIEELVVDDRVESKLYRYPVLRQDDGTTVALRGDPVQNVAAGMRVEVEGTQNGRAFLVTSVHSAVSPASPMQRAKSAVEIEGRLAIAHSDDFIAGTGTFLFEVHEDSGRVSKLALSFVPPSLKGGMRVIVSGALAADGASIAPSLITITGAAPMRRGDGADTEMKAAHVNKVLVIMAYYNDAAGPPAYLQSTAQAVMVSNTNSVSNFYNEASYGQETLQVTVTPWIKIGMATPGSGTCPWSNIGTASDTAATAAGYNTANYDYIVHLMNSWTGSNCGFSGLAYVGFPHWSYINGTGSFGTSVVAHEMGHNFGLWHAGSLRCTGVPVGCGGSGQVAEYGDPFDTMGNQRAAHFNATQKYYLGWFSATQTKTHSSGTHTYTLAPIEIGGGVLYGVQIPTSNPNRTYWLEYRQPLGAFDNFAFPDNGVQVRVEYPFEASSGSDDTEILDMTPGTATFNDAALLVGQQFTDASTGVTLNVQSYVAGAAGNVVVQVTTAGGAATTTTVASSQNPALAGVSVTFTATVTGTAPTGTVNFTDGGVAIAGCGAKALSGAGNSRTATCASSALAVGSHNIVASYSGDAANAASASTTLVQTINSLGASTTTLSSSQNPSTLNTNVTFTATVTGTGPTGTVNFTDGGSSLAGCGAINLTGSGNSKTAQCSSSALAVGTHSIVASYSGDAGNSASASSALSQVVNKLATTTTLASSQNPSTVGASVTFTATVTGSAPTGTVNFTNGGSSISGCSAQALSGAGNSRTATCSTSGFSAGTHSVVASYSGDATNNVSTSSTLSQVVNAVGSSLNVALAANGGVASASSTYSASYPVSAVNNGDRTGVGWGSGGGWNDATANAYPDWVQITFSGQKTIDHVIVYTLQDNWANPVDPPDTLTFTQWGITDFQLQTWNGSAWVNLGAAVSGNNLVKRTVSFSPTTTDRIRVNITGAMGSYSRLVEIEAWTTTGGSSATTTTLASSINPSTSGGNVTFTATVNGVGPTGTVNFKDGATSITGCSSISLTGSGNSKTAQCSTSALTVGSHSIVANYSGDASNNASASSTLTQTVNAVAQINVALASNGGVASASSTYSASYPVAAVNNGDRAGLNWGSGGGWNDATAGVYPDWVQVNFSGQKTIDHVIVYSVQDNWASPVDPSNTLTFTQWGLTAFQLQSWNGSAWVNLGAAVSGNNLVKRTVNFSPTTTDRIRVNITGSLGTYSRITEIEAWGN
jgi:hypothetical protein